MTCYDKADRVGYDKVGYFKQEENQRTLRFSSSPTLQRVGMIRMYGSVSDQRRQTQTHEAIAEVRSEAIVMPIKSPHTTLDVDGPTTIFL